MSEAEARAGKAIDPPRPLPRLLEAAKVDAVLAHGSPTERPATLAPRFVPGQRVRTRGLAPDHHTRLPAYARGRVGTVVQAHGAHVFADTNARGLGEDPQWLYSVAFDGVELWGAGAQPGLTVTIDAWDAYLEPA